MTLTTQSLTEEEVTMFSQALESMGKVTGAAMTMQREMFKKWIALWPGLLSDLPGGSEQGERFRQRWADTVSDLFRRQREVAEGQFQVGLENIEKVFQLGEAKTAEELRTAVVGLWRKCFDSLRQATEAQVRETHLAVEKWFDLLATSVPSS